MFSLLHVNTLSIKGDKRSIVHIQKERNGKVIISSAGKVHLSADSLNTWCGITKTIDEVRDYGTIFSDNPANCKECLKKYARFRLDQYEQEQRYADEKLRFLYNFYTSILNTFRNPANRNLKDDASRRKNGSYPFIPMGPDRFLRVVEELKNKRSANHSFFGYRKKFLDAGCGIGNILLMAKSARLAGKYVGLEYYSETVKQACAFMTMYLNYFNDVVVCNSKVSIKKANILTFKNYADYDIIYYYCPLCDEKLQSKFEEKVEDEMKVGALLLPFLKKSKKILNDSRFEEIKLNHSPERVWIKISN